MGHVYKELNRILIVLFHIDSLLGFLRKLQQCGLCRERGDRDQCEASTYAMGSPVSPAALVSVSI